jgi:uncharacterized protein (TIGR03435 family)
MKRLMLWLIAVAALPGNALFAQTLAGTWQGTVQAGKDLRIVIKISTTDADTFKAVLYSINDQMPQGMPAGPVTLQGSTLKMSVPGIGAAYEGKVSADGNSITGTWSQGIESLPLNLTRATSQTAWMIPDAPVRKAMPADANPVFEVATIKLSGPDEGLSIQVSPGGRQFTATDISLRELITFAHGIHPRQVAGGPPWLETEKYDLLARADVEGIPSETQLRTMLQKLLADRFQLNFHREKKELTVYTIVPGKTGPKLTGSEGDPNGLPTLGFRGLGSLFARNANMSDFAGLMQTLVLDRPVVDRSGVSGRYDFTLNWTADESQFGGRPGQPPQRPDNADVPPDLFTAIQQQLGLKMESAKLPVEVLVIDHVDKPSEN